MRFARASLRLGGLAAVTAILYAAVLPARAESRRARLARAWARAVAAILGIRMDVTGAAPPPPFFLVANHLSYVDAVVLLALTGGAFVAKSEVARWPVIGALCRAAGTIFVDRERRRDLPRAAAEVEQALRAGRGVVVFPEGTSTEGADVLPFRPSLLEPAIRAGVPVSHAAITYATRAGSAPASRAVCWWGDMRFAGHFWKLLALPRIEARVVFGEQALAGRDRKVLAAGSWRAVRAAFQPVS